MKKHHSFFTATGIPSLFLIFAVLCLAVLSLLSLGSSRSELNASRLSMQQTEAYYNACAQATDKVNNLQGEAVEAYNQADSESDYFSLIQKIAEKDSDFTWDARQQTLLFSESISDTQQLTVKLKLSYPETDKDSFIQILQWQTDSTASWNPDNSQSVYKGGKS